MHGERIRLRAFLSPTITFCRIDQQVCSQPAGELATRGYAVDTDNKTCTGAVHELYHEKADHASPDTTTTSPSDGRASSTPFKAVFKLALSTPNWGSFHGCAHGKAAGDQDLLEVRPLMLWTAHCDD